MLPPGANITTFLGIKSPRSVGCLQLLNAWTRQGQDECHVVIGRHLFPAWLDTSVSLLDGVTYLYDVNERWLRRLSLSRFKADQSRLKKNSMLFHICRLFTFSRIKDCLFCQADIFNKGPKIFSQMLLRILFSLWWIRISLGQQFSGLVICHVATDSEANRPSFKHALCRLFWIILQQNSLYTKSKILSLL